MPGPEAVACAAAFQAKLEVNAGMRSRCIDRGSFQHEFSEWKHRGEAAGRTYRCGASDARFFLSRRKRSRPSQPGRPCIRVVSSGRVTLDEATPPSPTTSAPPEDKRRQTRREQQSPADSSHQHSSHQQNSSHQQQQSPAGQEPDERETASAVALWAELEVNARMRAKCTSKASFKLQLWLWKQRESVAGRTHKFTASAALKILQRLNGTPPSQPGLQLIHVASSGKVTTVNQTAPPPSGSKHTRTRESREEVEASKHGVEVSHFIFDDIVANRSTALVRGVVTNHDPTPCVLRSVHLFAVASYPPLILPVALGSGGSWRPSVSCRPTADGVCHGLLWFTFNTGGISFRIGRLLEARCGDELILDMLKPTAPYVRAKAKGAPLSAHEVHQAVKAPLKEATGDAPRHKLKEYALEKFLFRDVLRAGGPDVFEVLERGNKLLCFMRDGARLGLVPNDAAAMAEYTAHQQRLLVTEEVQLIHDLHMFDMVGENATVLTRRANLLWLRVEGLAEKRPSVLLGDKVLIRLADGSAIKQRLRYEGVAERIEMNDVGLKIKNDFVNSYLPGQRVEVNFQLSRCVASTKAPS